jgi:hypothetical protein
MGRPEGSDPMARARIFQTWFEVLILFTLAPILRGQSQTPRPGNSLRTDRLDDRQRETWASIERLADALDSSGYPLHPGFHGLWTRARACPFPIYVEFSGMRPGSTIRVGEVIVAKVQDGQGKRAIVLRLFTRIIDAVQVVEALRRRDGLLPFEKLGRVEKYAEVTAHELAHALQIAEDPEYARMCEEWDRKAAEVLTALKERREKPVYSDAMKARMQRLETLGELLEAPANTAEAQVWRELVAGQRPEARRDARLPRARIGD